MCLLKVIELYLKATCIHFLLLFYRTADRGLLAYHFLLNVIKKINKRTSVFYARYLYFFRLGYCQT